MPVREPAEDPKVTALRESRCLNPHPEQVTDPVFLADGFFDARDAVQVKYEMVRAVTVDGAPVTAVAAAFGYSRPSYYQAAAALAAAGLQGLVPARPGPRGGHKLTGPILARAEQQLAADPQLKAAGLADLIAAEFGVRVHPRSVERALARRRERPKSR
jgi:transposase